MREKARRAVESLRTVLEGWSETVAVGVHAYGDDLYDPYFSVSLDVYTSGDVRAAAAREPAFGDVGAFESSLFLHKDRFLMDDVPVRVEYKRTDRFDGLVAAALDGICLLRDASTYAFTRVTDADPVVSRGGWFETMRDKLERLPEPFWLELRAVQAASAEHRYADLQAAAMREDTFYYTVTAGRFLVGLCALVFTINRSFEPSPRRVRREVLGLPMLPDSFPANLENFVRRESELSLSQRAELAQLMVTSVLSL
jgi:hypothetical protein